LKSDMKFVASFVFLAVLCIACDPDDLECLEGCNPLKPVYSQYWCEKTSDAKILILKSLVAKASWGIDPLRAVNHYKKLLKMARPYDLGILRIDAIWRGKDGESKLSNLTIPLPLKFRRDKITGDLRVKVDEYLTTIQHENVINRPEDWHLGASTLVSSGSFGPSGSKWTYLYSLWINLGSGRDVETIQIVFPPTVAPTTKTPTKKPTKKPTTKKPTKQPTRKPWWMRPISRHGGQSPLNRSVVPTVTTDISSANFLVIGVASVMPFFLTFF